MRKKSGIISFIEFIIFLLILAIFAVTLATALDVLGFIDLPDNYSLVNYLKIATADVSIIDYEEIDEEEQTKRAEPDENEYDENGNIIVEIPAKIESIYNGSGHNAYSGNSTNQGTVSEKYYYDQLDDYAKKLYDKLYSNIENLKTGTYMINYDAELGPILEQENGSELIKTTFESALNAFIYDNPEVFYIDVSKMYIYTEIITRVLRTTYKVKIGPAEGGNYFADGFNSKEEVDIAIAKLKQKVEDIKTKLISDPHYNVRAIHDYLVDNIEYDQTISKPNIYNIYGALVNGVCVCDGYAKATKYLLDEIGVDSMYVSGIGRNNEGQTENHAWNYVKLNDTWYALDVTWDDPIIIGGGYLTSDYKYKYFLKGSTAFSENHQADGIIAKRVKFYYPPLSQVNY